MSIEERDKLLDFEHEVNSEMTLNDTARATVKGALAVCETLESLQSTINQAGLNIMSVLSGIREELQNLANAQAARNPGYRR